MIHTARLRLRQWTEADFAPFASLCQDREVMRHFPKVLSQSQSYAMATKIRDLIAVQGWGFWAVEIPDEHPFIGFVGLHRPQSPLPFAPCTEIGWRLASAHWGNGYATEAANACLRFGFTQLDLDDIVAFTTVNNDPSRAVMTKIGMTNTQGNFNHPDISPDHPCCEHVLYRLTRSEWKASVPFTASDCPFQE